MAKEKEKLQKTYGRFYGLGKIKFNKNTFEIDVTSKNNEDWVSSKATFHLDCGGKERLSFIQLFGGYNSSEPRAFKVFGKDDNGKDDFDKQIEIDWEDRNDEETLKTVANFSLITIGLEKYVDSKDKKEKILYKKFLSPYDAVPYVKEHLTEGTVVKVSGSIGYSPSNKGETSKNLNITYLALFDAEEKDFYANFSQYVLVDKESLDAKVDEDGLVSLYVKVIDYSKNDKKNVVLPYLIHIDPTRYKNWENTKKKFQPTKKQVWVWGLEGKFILKSETVEITKDDLPDDLKEMIEDGMLTEEEAKGRVASGNKAKEFMLFTAFSTKKNKDGVDIYDKDEVTYTTDDYIYATKESTNNNDNDKDDKSTTTTKKQTQTQKDPFVKPDDMGGNIDDDIQNFLNNLKKK